MHVERLRRPEPVGIPDLVHDPFPAQDLPGVRHQEVQQIELAGGELDRVVVLGDGARGGIETERPDLDRALLISAAAAPHDGSDPRRELARRDYRQGQGLTREQYLAYCLESLEELLRRRADRLGTLIIEPLVQGAGGIITAEPGFLAGVRALCDRYELLLIADEVAIGFGRTGRMFACEHERVTPDLLCLAKGLSGGYLPIAATLATGRIYERFRGSAEQPRVFYHGHSFTGNPLAAAVSIASLELFEEERVLERLQPKIELLGQWLERRVAPLEHVGEVRRRGLMVGIELVEDRASRRGHDPAWRTGARVCAEARRHGVILRPLGDVVVLMPHLSFSAPELEALVEAAARSIEIVTGTRPRGDAAGA